VACCGQAREGAPVLAAADGHHGSFHRLLTQDDAGRYTLTPAGQAGHAAVKTKVHGIRSTFVTGLTEQDYRATVQVLQRMAENMERAAAQDPPAAA